jgi:redox-regulated HSP33 family molecular chaperone
MPNFDYTPAPAGDFVLPFDIVGAGVRGRLVRLDASSARALSAHALPEPAARIAGEVLALAALLGTALKLDGRLTAQTKSDGPLDLIVADYYGAEGDKPKGVRGFARLDAERYATFGNAPSFAVLAGAGSVAITIEPRRGGKTYQGIVTLSPEGIAASAETYFAQSEQLPTLVRLAAAPVYTPGSRDAAWRAGGLMRAAPGRGLGAAHRARQDRRGHRTGRYRAQRRNAALAAVPRGRGTCAAGRADCLSLRLRRRAHRRGAALLCARGTRRSRRPRWHPARPLRILRADA